MIDHDSFPVEPWCVRETTLDLDVLAQSESLFALSNGHLGLRGNLDEGEPHGLPGTYLGGFYEDRPLPYAEAAYGDPEVSQSVVNVTNGKIIRLLVEDEPFDLRYGHLHAHERVLDLRTGTLDRTADWTSPGGHRVRVRSRRLVSFTQRAVAAVEYVVEAVGGPSRLVLQSELVANEAMPSSGADPRAAASLGAPLVAVASDSGEYAAVLVHRTRASGLQVAAAMDHQVSSPGHLDVSTRASTDWAVTTVITTLQEGQQLRLVKLLGYGWSALRSAPALRDQVAGALAAARATGWEGLLAEQRTYLDDFWDAADVRVEGDPEIQQAVRFALFHVLQAGARAEQRGIAAKGLTGPGYDGHVFWDSETYVLPLLTYTAPGAVRDALLWRCSLLDLARQRAGVLGLAGATFPWRTIAGQESSGYWPASTAAFHLDADIAAAVERYRVVTGDESLERDGGLAVLVETARMWLSLGHHDRAGHWHVVGVTGPDEYTAVVPDNAYTNLAAAHNLRTAAEATERHPDLARTLGAGLEEVAAWRDAAAAVHVPYDDHLRVHQQSAGFTQLPEWDFEGRRGDYPLLLHAPYVDLYRRQVVKQADLELAMLCFGERFGAEDAARNVDYYERRTVRDSSLSASVQAAMAAQVGHLELAHDYAGEAALVDLRDLHHNTRDGLHIASLAGTWIALVAGFGGLRERKGMLAFDPALPTGITRLGFTVRWHGLRLSVDVVPAAVTYTLRDDGHEEELRLVHAGREVTVRTSAPLVVPLVARTPLLPRPVQPAGRAPARRGLGEHPAGAGGGPPAPAAAQPQTPARR